MKMNSRLLMICLSAILLCGFASALTGSIGNARMILYPEVGFWGTTVEKTILVKNVNNVSVNISLEATNETFAKMVEILDKNFVLAPGENKNARFEIKIKNEGRYEGKINIFFSQLEGNKAGVVLSSNIIIFAAENQDDEEIPEDEEETDIDEDGNETSGITGAVTGTNKNNSTLLAFLLITPIVLIILLFLLIFMKKGKLKKKRSDRSS